MINKNKKLWLTLFLTIAVLALLYWAIKDIPLSAIVENISQLSLLQVAVLLAVNTVIMLLFGLRWWLILREQGFKLPYLNIALYRLAGFGVSYFTPGPQFGGEPLQVIFLQKRHAISGSKAAASVALDKLIELIANFSFLLIAGALLLNSQLMVEWDLSLGRNAAIALLILPVAYFAALYGGKLPISALSQRMARRFRENIESTEKELLELVQNKASLLLLTLVASALVWLALVFEYKLALSFLGLDLPLASILAIMFLARLAMLAPTPGALGALEASLVFSMGALNLNPATGISLGLLIRARDLLFAGFGLLYGIRARSFE